MKYFSLMVLLLSSVFVNSSLGMEAADIQKSQELIVPAKIRNSIRSLTESDNKEERKVLEEALIHEIHDHNVKLLRFSLELIRLNRAAAEGNRGVVEHEIETEEAVLEEQQSSPSGGSGLLKPAIVFAAGALAEHLREKYMASSTKEDDSGGRQDEEVAGSTIAKDEPAPIVKDQDVEKLRILEEAERNAHENGNVRELMLQVQREEAQMKKLETDLAEEHYLRLLTQEELSQVKDELKKRGVKVQDFGYVKPRKNRR